MNIKLLEKIPIFENLPTNVLEQIASAMTMNKFPPNTVIFREGDRGDELYIVLDGQLDVIKSLGSPEEQLIASRGPGEFVGELSLVNRDGLRTASIRTHGATQLWQISHGVFNALLQKHSELSLQLIRALGARLTYAHNMSIQDLHEKNEELQKAYDDLKAAYKQIVEKERLEKELQVARRIQLSILPNILPQADGYEFGALMEPARAVGGDFYDIFQIDKNRIGILIGDVTDKGVPSALYMAQSHALIYSEAMRCKTPVKVLRRVNTYLSKMGSSHLFVTVIYGIIHIRERKFHYARAGHEIPILHLGKEERPLPWNRGQPLGLMANPFFDEQTVILENNSSLFLYSDGITDCRNAHGEFFGIERVHNFLHTHNHLPAQEICDQLWQSLLTFKHGAVQDDDVTLLVIKTQS
jgi:serine phosphatase RsbU (regulator of sigma subunit)